VRRAAFISLLLAGLVVAGCRADGPLSKESFQKDTRSIQSLAAEGALVADGAADGTTTEYFVRVHSQYLEIAARKLETKLASARASGRLDDDRAKAVRLAGGVAAELGELHRAPGDRGLARRLTRRLGDEAEAAEKLAK